MGKPGGSRGGLGVPTTNPAKLARLADELVESIYKPGLDYKKAGVMLSGIEADAGRQLTFFEPDGEATAREKALLQVVDAINAKYGRRTVDFAACGTARPWAI